MCGGGAVWCGGGGIIQPLHKNIAIETKARVTRPTEQRKGTKTGFMAAAAVGWELPAAEE